MSRTRRSTLPMASLALWIGAAAAQAQDAPKAPPNAEQLLRAEKPNGGPRAVPVLEFKDEIKPLPPVAIPDDPPPHEGALIDVPITIEPPDIIIVEVLEALPGRPITGERLVRPDGTISLGFYGDVHVRGLSLRQAKERIVIRLHEHIDDFVLGLLIEMGGPEGMEMPEVGPVPTPEGGRSPFQLDPGPKGDVKPVPDEATPPGQKPDPQARPGATDGRRTAPRGRLVRPGRQRVRRATLQGPAQEPGRDKPNGEKTQEPATGPAKPEEKVVVEVEAVPAQYLIVEPVDTRRVFVDIVSHNAKAYYVQGDVGVPGRLPVTGKETILDALNYAGGLIPSAEPADIHLYRPARGGKPAKDYKIDYQAILRGESTANLQVFPNDRLVVGRNSIVKKTVELDRAAAAIDSLFHAILSYGSANRTLGTIMTATSGAPNVGEPATTPARREATIKDWAEFLWSLSSKDGGAMLDEQVFKAVLMKKLSQPMLRAR